MQSSQSSERPDELQNSSASELYAKEPSPDEKAGHPTTPLIAQETAKERSSSTAHTAEKDVQAPMLCIEGINQIVLVLQPDESMQYMLFSEERALRDAAAKQAALEANELGLVSTCTIS